MKSIKVLLLALLTFVLSVSYSQIEKYEKKYKLEKKNNFYVATKNNYSEVLILDEQGNEINKFDYKDKHFIDLTSTGKLLYGTRPIGFNDGGGFVTTEIAGFTIEDLNTKEVKTPNYNYTTKAGKDLELYFVKSGNYIGGIDKDGKTVIDIKYIFINPFNANLESVAFTEDEYFVIDPTGQKKYDVTFKHKNSKPNYINIDNRKIIGSYDGVNVGYYDLASKKELIPFIYSHLTTGKQNRYFDLYKGNTIILYDLEKDQILLPESVNASSISKLFLQDGKYIIAGRKTLADGKSSSFIYREGEIVTEGTNDLDDINLSYPLTTGKLNDGSRFVFDLRTNKLVMYGIPKIIYEKAEVFKKDEKYIVVSGTFEGNNTPTQLKNVSLLVDTNANILTPFLPHASFKVFKFDNGNTIVVVNHRQLNTTAVNVYLNNKRIIADLEKTTISEQLNNNNQIEIKQNIVVDVYNPNAIRKNERVSKVVRTFIDSEGKITKTEPTNM